MGERLGLQPSIVKKVLDSAAVNRMEQNFWEIIYGGTSGREYVIRAVLVDLQPSTVTVLSDNFLFGQSRARGA